jgi:hypothetical protein
MVENQKTSQIKLDFLDTLYNLILTEDITDEERRMLTKAKNLVEKRGIYSQCYQTYADKFYIGCHK